MSHKWPCVFVAGTGSFLPNAPVENESVEELLGPLPDAPARVQSFVENMGPRILESGGVTQRHFAIDPETRRLTHTVTALSVEAARAALEAAGRQPNDIELLLLSAPNYDYSTPPTSTLVQEKLGIERCAEMEVHSNCSGVGKCVQIAWDALRVGRYKRALVIYSQLSSVYLRDCYFNQAQMTKTQAALRYILADGSGALVLEAGENDGNGHMAHEVLGTYVESTGSHREPGMRAGGGVADLVEWGEQIPGMHARGAHHLEQDFTAVSQAAVPFLLQGTVRMIESLKLKTADVDHYVFSIPGRQLYEANVESLSASLGVGPERIKFRVANTGYCGGASILTHFDQMVRTGELKRGEMVALASVESSKWMTGGFVVRW